jgi:NADPH:quinone reductase-like Zn-dependent oxidoreductase
MGANWPFQSGGWAQYCTSDEKNIALKPKNLSWGQTASVPYSSLTAWIALKEYAKIQPGERVMIVSAAGAIGSCYLFNILGTFSIQLLKNMGVKVFAVSSETTKHKLEKFLEKDQIFSYDQFRNGQALPPVDAIFDCAGGDDRLKALDLMSNQSLPSSNKRVVSVRGDLIKLMDNRGIILGFASAMAELYGEKMVRNAGYNVGYHWALFR